MRRLGPIGVSFCVLAGVVLARFNENVVPGGFLTRPLAVGAFLAVVIGSASLLGGRHAVFLAAAASLLVALPGYVTVLVVLIVATVVLVARILRKPTTLSRVVAVFAAVFFLSGGVQAIPRMSLPLGTPAHAATYAGPPVYLVLLDGYPRADTLTELGVEISPFIEALRERGFEHYPSAESTYGWTHLTLTMMLGGGIETADKYGSTGVLRSVRSMWNLPAGFVTIGPPIGHVTIPNATDIGPGGITDFEIDILGRSALSVVPWTGDIIMDALRRRLDESLDKLAATDEERVFAHLMAPHTPFLYAADGQHLPPLPCWPYCDMFDVVTERLNITVDGWVDGIEGNLAYLNRRLVETVDAILARRPDAVIVLFSDHGGRYTLEDPEEWHRTFLAARTPTKPGLFADDPGPGLIFERLHASAAE